MNDETQLHVKDVDSPHCNTQPGKVATITLPRGIPGVVIGVTKGITHGSEHDRKPISLGTTVPRPTDFS